MKYISIKILPNGKIPPNTMLTRGCKYHFFSGTGLGTGEILHGLSAAPLQLRPTIVPTRLNGNDKKIQIDTTATMVPNGIAANEPYPIAIKLSKNAVPKQASGNREAVKSITLIQFLPSLRA